MEEQEVVVVLVVEEEEGGEEEGVCLWKIKLNHKPPQTQH